MLTSLSALVGSWNLSREITHHAEGTDRFLGTSRFVQAEAFVVQEDKGTLETKHGSFEATRRYIWTETDGRLDVFFDDMRPFHSVPLGALRPEATHLCPPDTYHVTYDFREWPRWRSVWRVEGPRKRYIMESLFTPHLASAETAGHNAPNI
ncbi:MAG: DUF6314 family protein [Pseudomonadota bacterium]